MAPAQEAGGRDGGETAPAAAMAAPAPQTERFDDWTVECFDEVGACQTTHRVVSGDGSQIVMVLALTAGRADAPASLQVAVPLGISALAGAQLAIGNAYQADIPISRCTPQGCLIEGTPSDALLSAMRAGQQGRLTVFNESGAAIPLPFSLMGFTASFADMIARNTE